MFKAVNYARISEKDSDKTEKERRKKLDDQLQLNNFFIQDKKWECVNIYDEGYAKSTDRNRKEFTKMRLGALDKQFKIIVVKDQTRLARDSAFLIDFLKDMEALGIKVYESSTGRELIETEIETRIKATIVDTEPIRKGKIAQALMMEDKIKEGKPFGRSPFGYDNDLTDDETSKTYKNWIVKKKEAKIVKKIFKLYLKHKKVRIVAKKVKMSEKKVWRILTNKSYTGVFSYVKKFRGGDKKVLRTEAVEYKCDYKALIKMEVFIKVNEILKR